MVPALEPIEYLNKARPKRRITGKKFENYQRINILEKQVKNNTKCFEIPTSKTPQYSQKYFTKTVIEWYHTEDTVVPTLSVDSFKTALAHRQ